MSAVVELKNIYFRYDMRMKANILSNVSYEVNRGEWIAIIGKNGSGKSTLAKLLVGLITPHAGHIYINNLEMNDNNKWKIREQIGMVFQNPDNQFIGTTVEDDVAFGLENLNLSYEEMRSRVDHALDIVGMTDYKHVDPSRLSGGQKQRVAIAGCLAFNPHLLILDEAFVMLDPKSREYLLEMINHLKVNKNMTIISITHDMNEAAVADKIVVIENGKIIKSGLPGEIFMNDPDLEPPFFEKLRRAIEQRNGEVPNTYMTEEEMVRLLWK